VTLRDFRPHERNTAQAVKMFGFVGHDAELVPPVRVDPVGSKQLGHPLHVPARNLHVAIGEHETVRHLVNDEVAAIVVGLLLVDPEFLPAMPPVEKGSQVLGKQARAAEESLVRHQVAGDLKLGPLRIRRQGAEVVDQRVINGVDGGEQGLHFFGCDVGIELEPLRLERGDAQLF
jgi:hypothetical protein